ncbi:ADP-ribosylation factor-like protein 9 [Alexandromys fortis]|uniref:ADP-ribosylation factor-like protein 9 n=1 Tax=Alexandromys fortis TaxID=100897 RepID=UPI002152293D|nr:ADP-ribosylation factor-like protein 9 [Microtus fortis]
MERGKAKERDKFSSSSRESVKAEKEKRKDVDVKSKGKETGKGEEKRKDVGQKSHSGKSKEEEKRKSVDAKIKENGKEKGKEEEKRKSVDIKLQGNGKEKGKEEKKTNVDLKHKENGKGKEVKEEQGMENEEEQVTEKVKDSSSTSIKNPPPLPVRDLGGCGHSDPPGSVTSSPKYAENRILSEGVCLWMAGMWGNVPRFERIPAPNFTPSGTRYCLLWRDQGSLNWSSLNAGTGSWLCPSASYQEKSNQILVVGLDGAGKTSVLHSLASNRVQHSLAPTQGFNEVCISTEDRQMEFLEIGGREPFRAYWDMYLPKVWLLIFVVDSADHSRLPEARRYLHQLIAPNPGLPLVVFANKQDLEDAYHIIDIHDALALSEVGSDRKLFLFGTQVTENGSEIPSTMQDARDLIAHLAANM